MTTNKWHRVVAIVCTASFLVTSCTTLDHVSIPRPESSASPPAVQVGDFVVVTTKTGEEKQFKVTAVETDALAGKGVRVLYVDMASLGVERADKGRTVIAVALVILGILVVIGVNALNDGVEESIETIGH